MDGLLFGSRLGGDYFEQKHKYLHGIHFIHGKMKYTFGVITYNFCLFTVLPTKISSNIIRLNTNGVFTLCIK